MAKKRKRRTWSFLAGMLVYALVFAAAAGFGLRRLWVSLADYEAAEQAALEEERAAAEAAADPQLAIDAYMESLTAAHICDESQALIDLIDHDLQPEDDCRQVILDALADGFTYAGSSLSTDTQQVFDLYSGGEQIGSFSIHAGAPDEFGYCAWSFYAEGFDLSFLLHEAVTVSVPESYAVAFDGRVLAPEDWALSRTEFASLSEFYDSYDLPYILTYQVGPYLGGELVAVLNEQGQAVEADVDAYLDNCDAETQEALYAAAEDFVKAYVAYTTNTGGSPSANLAALRRYMVSGGDLEDRMEGALDGLSWVPNRYASVRTLAVSQYTALGDGRYMVDVSYSVQGSSLDEDCRVKLMLVQSGESYLAETMVMC
ncbi:MAG: hypothetical protein LUH51_03610 [Firmicutes bacterium]|nr:hypothetical protein [Bacillota bacterium]